MEEIDNQPWLKKFTLKSNLTRNMYVQDGWTTSKSYCMLSRALLKLINKLFIKKIQWN